jgi:monoamine oxidase
VLVADRAATARDQRLTQAAPRVAPDGVASRTGTRRDADVIVIGAGLAGLNAALWLEEAGAKTLVVEGRDRIGGRVRTLDDLPGHPEAGGNGIGGRYARALDRARRLKVALIPIRPRTEAAVDTTAIHVDGKLMHARRWAGSAHNPWPDPDREKLPWDYAYALADRLNPLTGLDDWLSPVHAAKDRSLYELVRSAGGSDRAARLAGVNNSFAPDAWQLSSLSLFQSVTWFRHQIQSPQAYAVQGGNQRLPEAMAGALKAAIRLGARVAAVEQSNDAPDVLVTLADGTRLRAQRVLVTAPLAALRGVHFQPALSPAHAEAVAQIGTHPVYQVHFGIGRRFWEQDGLPASLWTDRLPGRVMALRYGSDPARADEISSLVAWINGAAARMLDRIPAREAAASVLREIEQIRPSTRGALQVLSTVSWQDTPFSDGAYDYWRPGEIARFAEQLTTPVGRVHFAGSHTARLENGMEGALESGERAALEILSALA